VPNMQGLFQRGHGYQAHSQNNGSTVGVISTTHQSGVLGIIQGDASRNITGNILNTLMGTVNPGGDGGFFSSPNGYGARGGTDYPSQNIHFNMSRVVPTANETRPVNMAVRFLVKAAK